MYSDEFLDRFWAKVDKRGGEDCWFWTASTVKGYGQIHLRGTTVRAHRVSYSIVNGPIPDVFRVDHICRVRRCVNPGHLRVVTNKQNMEHTGANRNSATGVRGVTWHAAADKYMGQVKHFGKNIYVGLFSDLQDAERAVIAKRNELFTHNNLDRMAVASKADDPC